MDELQRQTGGGLLFSSHLMKAEDPAESFLPVSLSLVVLSEKHSPHRGEVKGGCEGAGGGRDEWMSARIRRCRGFSLLQVIFLSAGDGGPLQGHTISPLCLSFPSSLARSLHLLYHESPNLSLFQQFYRLRFFFFFFLHQPKTELKNSVRNDEVFSPELVKCSFQTRFKHVIATRREC